MPDNLARRNARKRLNKLTKGRGLSVQIARCGFYFVDLMKGGPVLKRHQRETSEYWGLPCCSGLSLTRHFDFANEFHYDFNNGVFLL